MDFFFRSVCMFCACWLTFQSNAQAFNPRWLIIFSLSFKGSHSGPLIYPHLPLMGFKSRRLWLSVITHTVQVHLTSAASQRLMTFWLDACVWVCVKDEEWLGMRVLVCAYTLVLPFRRPLRPRLPLALPLSVSHVLYLPSFIQMEMRFTSFFPHCKWQGQWQMSQLA